ncbi:glycosyltransferase [Vibrio splendidus]
MKKILINASNLHFGGGVQVASSFINELCSIDPVGINIDIVCSSKVFENIKFHNSELTQINLTVVDVYGFKGSQLLYNLGVYDVCFTIFGPFYGRVPAKKHICGFAQPWIAYDTSLVTNRYSITSKCKLRTKYLVQELLFKKYDALIVETEDVKSKLEEKGFRNEISVVSNTYARLFDFPEEWAELDTNFVKRKLTLGFIGKSYPHKNLEVLKDVNEHLSKIYNLDVDFLFTLSPDDMAELGLSSVSNFHSVGELTSDQCPNFFRLIDALVFPSLLECFSVSPIEALKMNTIVFASDLSFIRNVYGESMIYIDPLSSTNIAKVIAENINDSDLHRVKLNEGSKILQALPTSTDRARKYLDIIGIWS